MMQCDGVKTAGQAKTMCVHFQAECAPGVGIVSFTVKIIPEYPHGESYTLT